MPDNKYKHFLFDISSLCHAQQLHSALPHITGYLFQRKKQAHAANELMQFVICSLIPYGMMGRMCNLCLPKKCPCLCCCCCKTTRTRGHGYGTLTKIRHHFVLGVRNLARGVARGESAFAFFYPALPTFERQRSAQRFEVVAQHILAFS